jgi:Ca2+-binding EF-hand superfamily protein
MRLSPERSYGPIEIELCDQCNQIQCICGNLSKNNNKNNHNDFSPENSFKNNNNNYDSSIGFNNSIINTNKNLKSFEINQFNDFLKVLMQGEKEIELNKIDLALKSDFNCEDAFRIFEKDGRGYITKEDLKFGLNSLGLNFNNDVINLIMKRFDLKKKNNINFQEFFDMLVPFDSEYRNIVELRLPLSNCPYKPFGVFSVDTMIYLKKVFMSIIDFENKVNNMRKDFYELTLKISEIFKLIDVRNFGFFTFEDYISYLKKFGFDEENLKIDLLFIRLDKNRNGKIEMYEVLDEIRE